MPQRRASMRILTTASLLVLLAAGSAKPDIAVKEGEQIAFLGDSITRFGMEPAGYVSLVIQGLKSAGVHARAIGAGFPGSRSDDMLERLQRDVIDRKPAWMVVSCGVNDVYHGANGVPLDAYRENMTRIVERAQAAGIRVMILTATMIGEFPGSANNQTLAAYNAFLRELATSKQCLLADLNADMQRTLAEREKAGEKRGKLLTSSGAHMNPQGNMMMATGVLRAFGVDEAALAKAKEAWLDIPGGARLAPSVPVTLRQLAALEAVAARQGKSLQALLQPALERDIADLLDQ